MAVTFEEESPSRISFEETEPSPGDLEVKVTDGAVQIAPRGARPIPMDEFEEAEPFEKLRFDEWKFDKTHMEAGYVKLPEGGSYRICIGYETPFAEVPAVRTIDIGEAETWWSGIHRYRATYGTEKALIHSSLELKGAVPYAVFGSDVEGKTIEDVAEQIEEAKEEAVDESVKAGFEMSATAAAVAIGASIGVSALIYYLASGG